MKKIVYSLLIVFGLILLTGCGKEVDFSKTSHIVCKKVEVNSHDTTTTELTFSYDKDEKLGAFKADSDVVYKEPMSQRATEITAKAMGLISKTLGVSFKSEVSENELHFTFSGNIKVFKKLMQKLDKNYIETKVTGDTKEEALRELTKEGFTCEDFK